MRILDDDDIKTNVRSVRDLATLRRTSTKVYDDRGNVIMKNIDIKDLRRKIQ